MLGKLQAAGLGLIACLALPGCIPSTKVVPVVREVPCPKVLPDVKCVPCPDVELDELVDLALAYKRCKKIVNAECVDSFDTILKAHESCKDHPDES